MIKEIIQAAREEAELRRAKAEAKAATEEAIELWRQLAMNVINEKFGPDDGFDERREVASACALMQKRIEEMYK